MATVICFAVGALVGASVYLLLHEKLLRQVLGLILLANAVSLLIFAMGRIERGVPPIVPEGSTALVEPYANPLPQALILTAIVIAFGLLSFTLALIFRVHRQAHEMSGFEAPNEAEEPR